MLSVLGNSIFGTSGIGPTLTHLLMLMVLSSAAASTQTTILPTARTTLSMAAYKALPSAFAKIHPRFLTPTVSTVDHGPGLDRDLRPDELHLRRQLVIADAVIAIGLYIAFYYGLTAFACVWYYRKTLTGKRAATCGCAASCRLLGGLIMYVAGIYSLQSDWVASNSYTIWTVPGLHWQIGGSFLIAWLLRAGRRDRLGLPADRPARLLQEADPHPGRPRPWSRTVADPPGRVASLAGQPRSLPSCRSGPGRTNHAPFDRMIASGPGDRRHSGRPEPGRTRRGGRRGIPS